MNRKRYQPFYKQVLQVRKNIQNRVKLFRLKKQKWVRFQNYAQKQLKFFKRFKVKDQYQLSVAKFRSRGNSFRKKFKNDLLSRKTLKLFYGELRQSYLNCLIEKVRPLKNPEKVLFYILEHRIDVILYRANFASSIKHARQMILHGHIKVNGKKMTICSYVVKPGSYITASKNLAVRAVIRKQIDMSNFWPLPPKHLVVNYKTLQVIPIAHNDQIENFQPVFNHYLNIDTIIT